MPAPRIIPLDSEFKSRWYTQTIATMAAHYGVGNTAIFNAAKRMGLPGKLHIKYQIRLDRERQNGTKETSHEGTAIPLAALTSNDLNERYV